MEQTGFLIIRIGRGGENHPDEVSKYVHYRILKNCPFLDLWPILDTRSHPAMENFVAFILYKESASRSMCVPHLSLCVGPVQGDDKISPSNTSFFQKVSHKGLGHKMSTTMWCEMGGLFWVQFQNSNVVEWAVFSVLQETKPHWCPTTRGQDTHHTRTSFSQGRETTVYIYISLPNINSQWEGVIHEQ